MPANIWARTESALQRDGCIHWSMKSVWRRFLQPDTVKHTQPWAFSSVRKSQSHSSSSLLPFHFSPYGFFSSSSFFSFFFLQYIKECLLDRVAGVHWSYSTPMSHTHPMCLLLATLYQGRRAGLMERKGGGVRLREKGGGGGEWGIWYALCMSDLYKTKRGQIVWMCVRGGEHGVYMNTRRRVAKTSL